MGNKTRIAVLALCALLVLGYAAAKAGDVFVRSDAAVPGTAPSESVVSDSDKPQVTQPETSAALSPERITKTFDGRCKLLKQCGDLAYIDCGSAYDGPAYYVKSATLDVVMKCGGSCMMPISEKKDPKTCTQCPPKEWTCGNVDIPVE